MKSQNSPKLIKALGLYQASTIVVGSVIGSGIFVSSAAISRSVNSGWELMAVWVFAGFLTALGALTQAEISSRRPVTGGLYAYFLEFFGRPLAFFYGWANLMIAGSGAIAAIAFICASYMGEFMPLWQAPESWQKISLTIPFLGSLFPFTDLGTKLIGSLLIIFLTLLNIMGIKVGAGLQSLSTSAKTFAILIIVFFAFILSDGSFSHLSSVSPRTSSLWSSLGLFFFALSGAFWSFDGWGNVAYIGDEVKNPKQNIPRSILIGLSIVTFVYLLVNLSYIYVLPLNEIANANGDRVASFVMKSVLGTKGAIIIAALILLSTFDTVNTSILANARVYLAMAQDGLFWKKAGEIHQKHKTPAVSLCLQGFWSIVLLISGSFDIVTSMYVFVNWLFYLLIPITLFLMRKQGKDRECFQTPLYPLIPIAFAGFTVFYLIQTLSADLREFANGNQPIIKSLMGLVLVLSGLPFYFLFNRKS